MKPFFGILRIAAMAVVAGLLIVAGESDAEAAGSATLAKTVPTSQSTGAALVLGAYGFLIMLRRRSLR